MSQHHGDYEDFVRGALHAAVDSVEPTYNGLERIRARLTPPRPLPVAWLIVVCSWVASHARGGLDSVSAWLQTVPRLPGRPGGAGERLQATGHQRPLERLGLVATVAAVTVLMAISVSPLTPLGRHVLSQATAVLNSIGGGGQTAGTGELGTSGAGTGAAGAAGGTQGGQPGQPGASCQPEPSALAVPPPSPGPASPGGTASTSTESPPADAPAPAASPGPAGPTSAGASAASPRPTPCTSPATSPGPSSPRPSPAGTSAASPPAASPGPSSPPAASPAPATDPGPSVSVGGPEAAPSG